MSKDDTEAARLAKALEAATRRYDETAEEHERSRAAAAEAVLAALKGGVPPTTVAELSPFTATYVRQLARSKGIPAATTRRNPVRKSARQSAAS